MECYMLGVLIHWITIFGWFRILGSDRGSAFTSEIIKGICKLLNVQQNLDEIITVLEKQKL